MKIRVLLTAILVLMNFMFENYSYSVGMNISANLIAGACNVDPNTINDTITFEDLYTGKIKQAGGSSNWQPVQVLLTACPVGTTGVTMSISGTPSEDNKYFANSKEAKNVVLQLTDATYTNNYSNGSVVKTAVDGNNNAEFDLAARIYSPQGGATAGSFESVVMLSFTYQ